MLSFMTVNTFTCTPLLVLRDQVTVLCGTVHAFICGHVCFLYDTRIVLCDPVTFLCVTMQIFESDNTVL